MSKFKPYAALLTAGKFVPNCIVAAETFMGVRVVYERPAMPELGSLGLGVLVAEWHERYLPENNTFPAFSRDENTSLQSGILRIKRSMLDHGATAEAVRLIGELSPFTAKELNSMAEKLKGKAAAPKADKAAPAKGKGNTEALAKAREARTAEGAKDKKYKVLTKLKDIKLRENSWTEAMTTAIVNNTSTDAAKAEIAEHKEFGDRRLDFKWAADKGYISTPA